MRKLYSFLFRSTWSFKVNIMTLFITLILISFASVIAFTYPKQYASDLSFSKGVAGRVSNLVLDKLSAISKSSERTTQVAASYFLTLGKLSFQDPKLSSFFLNVLKNNPNFSNCYVGLNNGSFIGGFNQAYSSKKTFVSEPDRLLPSGTAFSLRYVDVTVHPFQCGNFYLDENFKELAREVFTVPEYDARLRPWYIGAMQNKGIFWTGFYKYFITSEKGISIGYPMIDDKGEAKGVVGADLSFLFLSDFIKDQTIGKSGKVFIVDGQGNILVPFVQMQEQKNEISTSIVSEVFKQYLKKQENKSNFIVSHNDEKYLAYVTKLPDNISQDWRIVIVAPLNDFFGETFLMQKEVLLIIAAILIFTAIVIVYYARRISTPIVALSQEVDKIGRLDLKSEVRVDSNIKEIFLIDNAIASLRRAVSSFSKYVPKEIVRDLFEKNEEIVLGGEKRELTMFFSDISGFSEIVETHSIDELIPLLSEYFDAMSKIILASRGTIDKYLEDGVMAFWGAPLPMEDHAERACTAALLCKAMLVDLNQKNTKKGMPVFDTRFGINTGTVIVGNIGTQERMNYTVIGDPVNITFRLQGVDSIYHTSILISEDVRKQLGPEFILRPLDIVTVKGKSEKIKIYELIGKLGDESEIEATEDQVLLCTLFKEAYEAFQANDHNRAYDLFTSIAKRFPNDYPTQLYLKRVNGSN